MAMIYCEQLAVVLRIAALYGRNPGDPARAPEILVLQGRYPNITAATAALRQAGTKPPRQPKSKRLAGPASALWQIPSTIGLRVATCNGSDWRSPNWYSCSHSHA
jgi:hypothetical protein